MNLKIFYDTGASVKTYFGGGSQIRPFKGKGGQEPPFSYPKKKNNKEDTRWPKEQLTKLVQLRLT